jgi:hypothetical protein
MHHSSNPQKKAQKNATPPNGEAKAAPPKQNTQVRLPEQANANAESVTKESDNLGGLD